MSIEDAARRLQEDDDRIDERRSPYWGWVPTLGDYGVDLNRRMIDLQEVASLARRYLDESGITTDWLLTVGGKEATHGYDFGERR